MGGKWVPETEALLCVNRQKSVKKIVRQAGGLSVARNIEECYNDKKRYRFLLAEFSANMAPSPIRRGRAKGESGLKKKLLSVILCVLMLSTMLPVTALGDTDSTMVTLDVETFPDSAFRDYLRESFDEDIEDDKLCIEYVTVIDCHEQEITSLSGIEKFTELAYLDCSGNSLTELNVSSNAALTVLNCSYNQLAELNVSGNAALTVLDCADNGLTGLDVSSNTELSSLNCNDNNLTVLTVGSNAKLEYLECAGNQLTTVNTTGCPKLIQLACIEMDVTDTLTVNVADRSQLELSTLGTEAKVIIQVNGEQQSGPTIEGKLWNCGEEAKLCIFDEDGEVLCRTFGYDNAYRFDSVPVENGTYDVKLSTTISNGENSAVTGYRFFKVTVENGVVTEAPGIVSFSNVGNVNGDDNSCVDVRDVQALYTYLTTGVIEGAYSKNETKFAAAADINGDDEVDVYDLQYLYEIVSGLR